MLQNPMILIAIVGLVVVVGMPYLLDNSTSSFPLSLLHSPFPFSANASPFSTSVDPEMRAEFEEQQKKSILSGGASTGNPLQNFDMAAWMAGKTSGASKESGEEPAQIQPQAQNQKSGSGSGSGGGKGRRRG